MNRPVLWKRLGSRVDLRVPGFVETVPAGFVKQLNFRRRDAAEWYQEFRQRMIGNTGYLPLYRMSDGEFLFCCGKQLPPLSLLPMYPLAVPKAYVRWLLRLDRGTFRSGTSLNNYGYEAYGKEEWEATLRTYAERVRAISRSGILAINLVDQGDGFAREYLHPVCDWLESRSIELSPTNYFPFYFVYALLLGPDARKLYAGRRVLVVTSDQDDKSSSISRSLERLGAKSVAFVPISRDKGMLDRIDVTGHKGVDLVLIGAGVGALNILEQVESLGALSIDAGYVLDCLWRPNHFMGRRVFTIPDGGLQAFGLAGDPGST